MCNAFLPTTGQYFPILLHRHACVGARDMSACVGARDMPVCVGARAMPVCVGARDMSVYASTQDQRIEFCLVLRFHSRNSFLKTRVK